MVVQLAKVLQLPEKELLTLAERPDPTVERTIKEDPKMTALFRRVIDDADLRKRLQGWVKESDDASGR